LLILLLPVPLSASTIQQAPAFDLPTFDGENYNSEQLFQDHTYTYLVFWDSSCPVCVEALNGCQFFYNEHMDENIEVIGIHMDVGRMADAQAIVEENGITLQQLWDIGGEAAQAYDVPVGVFTVFLVDRQGRVISKRVDTGEHTEEAMTEMLAAAGTAPFLAADTISTRPPQQGYRFTFHGDVRSRFLSVDTRGEIPSGPYGQDVRPGNDLLYRFELEMARRITRHVRVGGLLRISNEGEEVLAAGPKYFGSEWGSAFAELTAAQVTARFGYYTIAMTPLTMMRWDWDDNPRFGGTAGCGCGATAGVLLLETLEELGPDLVFEGGIATHRWKGLHSRLFYGIPRRADRTTYQEYRSIGTAGAQYSLEIAGFESAWRRYSTRTGRHASAGVRAVAGWEDPRSVDFAGLGYPGEKPWFQSGLVSIDATVPLFRFVELTGEWIAWNKFIEKGLPGEDGDRLERTANGGMAGIVLDGLQYFSARVDYMRLDPGYYTPFAALSYIPNAEGGRASAKLTTADEQYAFSLFYKRLYEIEPPAENCEKQNNSVFGASLDMDLPSGVGGSIGWMDEGSWRDGNQLPVDDTRKSLFVGGRWRFVRNTHVELQYQRVETESSVTVQPTGDTLDLQGQTNLYSVYFRTEF
jgi:peroxiredoxin